MPNQKVIKKDKLLKKVIEELNVSLVELKGHFTEKKFEKRVKKAASLLIDGIKKIPVKKVHSSRKKLSTRRKPVVKVKATK